MTISRPMRWILLIVGAVVISAISIVGTLVWAALQMEPKPVPLTKDLSGTWAQMGSELTKRVQKSFPVGSSVSDMASELRKQGFVRQDWTTSLNEEHEARRDENSWVCDQAAYVFWRADDKGRLTAVRGQYREEGCL